MSIYSKIIITFLLAIIPLYMMTMLFNERSQNVLKREIVSSMTDRVNFYQRSLERELDNLYSFQNNLALDRKLQRYGVAGGYVSDVERVDLIRDIQRQLILLRASNQYVHEVRVHFFQQGTTISTTSMYAVLQQDEVEPLLRISQSDALLHWNNRLFLRMAYPLSLSIAGQEKVPLFLIETELSKPALVKMLSEFSLNGPEAVVLTSTDKDWELSNIEFDAASAEGSGEYLTAWGLSENYNLLLTSYAPEEMIVKPLQVFRDWFLALSLITLCIILIYSYSINKMLHQPFKTLIKSFRKLESGQFEVRVAHKGQDEFQLLYTRFNMMVEQIDHLITSVYQQKIRTQQAELKHLQSQINPHFLYNSLFVLHQMVIMQDYDNLAYFSKNLSDYFKMITRNAMQEVALAEEVRNAQIYVNIQAFRFSNRIRVTFDELPIELQSCNVPRLILQPIIENAFVHGLKNVMANGRIEVRFVAEDQLLKVEVTDNGEGLSDDRYEQIHGWLSLGNEEWNGIETTGLINVHQRLRLKFGQNAGVEVLRLQGGGLLVTLNIPLEGVEGDVDVPITGRG